MLSLEETLNAAVNDGTIPGAVLLASSKDGSFEYAQAFGRRTLKSNEAMKLDDVFLLASATKLMTTVAAMQCVERGLVGLEDDLTDVFRELGALRILTGFDEAAEGRPVLKERENPITLRHLLTHSSGISYDGIDPLLLRLSNNQPKTMLPGGTVLTRYDAPLVFEPDAQWAYGAGIDYAGKLVAILTGMPLEQYMREKVWGPLGIKDATFFPRERRDFEGRQAGLTNRAQPGASVQAVDGPILDGEDEMGGVGGYASMVDYSKILKSLLLDDGKLLKAETTAKMFSPQLDPAAQKSLERQHKDPESIFKYTPGDWSADQILDHGLGGVLTVHGGEGLLRGKGTMIWGGMANLFWSIDRENGICMVWGAQVYPPGDERTRALTTLAEKTMYERMEAARV